MFVECVHGKREEAGGGGAGGGVDNIPKHPPHPQLLCRPNNTEEGGSDHGHQKPNWAQCAALSRSAASQCYY